MKKIKFYLLTIIILLIYSCKSTYAKLEGTWVFDNEINILHVNKPSNYQTEKPIIFDLKKNNDLTIKSFGIKNNTFNRKWSLKSDSLIKLDNEEYIIKKIEKNRLILIDYNRADTYLITLKKPKKTKIKVTKKQIEYILKSNIWKSKDLSKNQEYNSFEFFNNNTVVFRYKESKEKPTEYLQNENWGIAEYENYFFLYNYSDLSYGKGNWEQISQILEISSDFFKLEKDSKNKIYDNKFYSKTPKNKNIRDKIIGRWKSKNSLDNDYGKYISKKQVEKGEVELFNKTLFMNITEKFIEFKTDTLTLEKFKWQIGKDNKTLVLEKEYNFDMRKGSFIKIVNLIKVSDNQFSLRFFENSFPNGVEKPYYLIINKVQNFERIEQN